MAEDTPTPPSQTLTRRLRSLIANLDAKSVESTANQVFEWIDSAEDNDDRFRGLLRLSAELILENVMERPNQDSHHVLGRFCKILDTATDGESSRFLNSLWKQEIQAAGVELLANNMAQAGDWPEYLTLVAFAGELCDEGLLQSDPLRSCVSMLSGSGSSLHVHSPRRPGVHSVKTPMGNSASTPPFEPCSPLLREMGFLRASGREYRWVYKVCGTARVK